MDSGEEAEVTDLDEARGEDVIEEAADEFDGRTRRARPPAGAKDDGGVVAVDGVPFLPALVNPAATADVAKAQGEQIQ